jgi:hypothetical protein
VQYRFGALIRPNDLPVVVQAIRPVDEFVRHRRVSATCLCIGSNHSWSG